MKGSLSSLFILFQLIGFSLGRNNEKIIKFPFKKHFGGYYMQIKVGEPPQFIFHGIDQGLTVTWTDSMQFDINKSTTMKIIKEDGQLKFQQMRLYGKEIEDTVFFSTNEDNNIILPNFPFYVIPSSRGYNSRVGGIGLAYKFTDNKYSLIHQMKKNNLISNSSFGIIPPKAEEEIGTIFFGGIPSEYFNGKKLTSCSVVGSYANWACDLSYVFFGEISYVYDNIYYSNRDYAYFQLAESRILAPEKFMEYLKNNIFNQYLNEQYCSYSLYGMNRRFECICSVGSSLPDFNFIFDNHSYKFSGKELMAIDHGDSCVFMIYSNHIRNNNWIFGTIFLSKYYSVFDYEEKQVNFYSNNENVYVDLESIFPWKKILRVGGYIILVLLSLCIIFYLYIKMKTKKKRRMKKLIENEGQEL